MTPAERVAQLTRSLGLHREHPRDVLAEEFAIATRTRETLIAGEPGQPPWRDSPWGPGAVPVTNPTAPGGPGWSER